MLRPPRKRREDARSGGWSWLKYDVNPSLAKGSAAREVLLPGRFFFDGRKPGNEEPRTENENCSGSSFSVLGSSFLGFLVTQPAAESSCESRTRRAAWENAARCRRTSRSARGLV